MSSLIFVNPVVYSKFPNVSSSSALVNEKQSSKQQHHPLKDYSDNFVKTSKKVFPATALLTLLWTAFEARKNIKSIPAKFLSNAAVFVPMGLIFAGLDSLFDSNRKK